MILYFVQNLIVMIRKFGFCLLYLLVFFLTKSQSNLKKAESITKYAGNKGVFGPTTLFNGAYSNNKYEYMVIKKDGTGAKVKSMIHTAEDGRHFLAIKDKGNALAESSNRIYVSETNTITFFDNSSGKNLTGIATDSCWLFKIISGKLSLYSCYPPALYLSNDHIIAFQVNDELIQNFDADKLRSVLSNNTKAVDIFDKKNKDNNYIRAVQKFNEE
jgi:hypothetical protein